MGGGMVDLKECLERNPDSGLGLPQLVYHVGNYGAAGVDQWVNKGGLIEIREAAGDILGAASSSTWPLWLHIRR